MIGFRLVLNVLGILIAVNGLLMLTALPFSFIYQDGAQLGVGLSGTLTMLFGLILWFFSREDKKREINKREGYLVVTLGWIALSFSGTLPYVLTGSIPDFTDAFFETMSGFTTTGASILTDIEVIPQSVLYWRSLTQWIGGLGIIVLTIAIIPMLGIGGMQLFVAEVSGLSPDKLHPRIKETAKRLWILYIILTGMCAIILWIGGMTLFEALCHSFTTLSTGGFSTRNESMGAFSSFHQYTVTIFMFLGGVNFTLLYFVFKGNFKKVFKNEEFRFYLLVVLVIIGFVAIKLSIIHDFSPLTSFRLAAFQVVSIITTTGFSTTDYEQWSNSLTMIMFILMFLGASAGSTSGGLKLVRIKLILSDSFLEFKRILHPRAIIPVRFNDKAVSGEVINNILAFFLIYFIMFIASSITLSMLEMDFVSAMSASVACLGSIGPGLGAVGPAENFSAIPTTGKWLLGFLMLCGRLELFTVLVLFSPGFWRKS